MIVASGNVRTATTPILTAGQRGAARVRRDSWPLRSALDRRRLCRSAHQGRIEEALEWLTNIGDVIVLFSSGNTPAQMLGLSVNAVTVAFVTETVISRSKARTRAIFDSNFGDEIGGGVVFFVDGAAAASGVSIHDGRDRIRECRGAICDRTGSACFGLREQRRRRRARHDCGYRSTCTGGGSRVNFVSKCIVWCRWCQQARRHSRVSRFRQASSQ